MIIYFVVMNSKRCIKFEQGHLLLVCLYQRSAYSEGALNWTGSFIQTFSMSNISLCSIDTR